MKNYKTAKKGKETVREKLSRQEKQKQYTRSYRRKIKDNETEEGKQGQLKKKMCKLGNADRKGQTINWMKLNQ